jgi:hypothetical protein
MAKGGCLFFFRAKWRVSSEPPSRGRGWGSRSNMASLLFTLTPGRYHWFLSYKRGGRVR